MECVLRLHPLPQPWQFRNPNTTPSQNPKVSFHLRCSYSRRTRKWDSNAETVRNQSFNFNSQYDDDYDDDEQGSGSWGKKKRRWWSDESPEANEASGAVLEDAIDSVWIFKVFRSFGWMLPAIILSFLVATGPKAFLMALALPLGQSALSLAFEKLWGRTQSRPKRRSRTRRKPFANAASDVELEEEEQEVNQDTRKGKMGYQSWVVGTDGSVNKGGQDAPSFGGWDELDRGRSKRRPYQATDGSRKTPLEKGKLSRKERRSDTPLLLRMLIAVFPFLGSWTRML